MFALWSLPKLQFSLLFYITYLRWIWQQKGMRILSLFASLMKAFNSDKGSKPILVPILHKNQQYGKYKPALGGDTLPHRLVTCLIIDVVLWLVSPFNGHAMVPLLLLWGRDGIGNWYAISFIEKHVTTITSITKHLEITKYLCFTKEITLYKDYKSHHWFFCSLTFGEKMAL